MAGISTKTCKTCRRLGMSVCGRSNCALKRKPYPPGIHGKSRMTNLSEFGAQLKEKQRLKFSYGLRERQFKNYILSAVKQKRVNTSDAILYYLESRLDNFVYRMGLSSTRVGARQLISHGHILVNGTRIDIPSYQLKVGDEISIREGSKGKGIFRDLNSTLKKINVPVWISLDKEKVVGRVTNLPETQDLKNTYNINSIVEYYSR